METQGFWPATPEQLADLKEGEIPLAATAVTTATQQKKPEAPRAAARASAALAGANPAWREKPSTPTRPASNFVGFGTAVRTSLFSKFADFGGRASRSEFWWFGLFVLLTMAVLGQIEPDLPFLALLIFLLPLIAAAVRRLRDASLTPLSLTLLILFGGYFVALAWKSKPLPDGEDRSGKPLDSPKSTKTPPPSPPRKSGPTAAPSVGGFTRPRWLASIPNGLITPLSFLLGSWIGGGARYIYLDNRETWRQPRRRTEFTVVMMLLTLITLGLGFSLISSRWWGRTRSAFHQWMIGAGLAPIGFLAVFTASVLALPQESDSLVPLVPLLLGLFALQALVGLAAIIPEAALAAPPRALK